MARHLGRLLAGVVQVVLAGTLVTSHVTTSSPYVYPHYVLLILGHPALLRRFGVRIAPWQIVWISAALFFHPMGGLYGLYRSIWWFDHLTHTMSATLVAAIGYTLVGAYRRRTGVPRWVVPAFTIAFVMAAGHLWEVIETYTPLLTVYGPNDTLWDYVFDFVGGILVVAFGPRFLADGATGLAEHVEEHRDGADEVVVAAE